MGGRKQLEISAEILFSVHQGSIIIPFVFNIYMVHLLFENNNLAYVNYADDNASALAHQILILQLKMVL